MTGFLFTLLAVLLTGLGARDQMLLAGLTERQGQRVLVLMVALVSAVVTVGLAALASAAFAAKMGGNVRLIFAGIALGLAAAELIYTRARPKPEEPTHSLGAFAIVIFAQQLTDAVRFLIFSLAIATRAPLACAAGGMIGAGVLMCAGWLMGGDLPGPALTRARRWIGLVLLVPTALLVLRGMAIV